MAVKLQALPNKRLVEKLLISLTLAYENIVSFIEGTKKLDEIDLNEIVTTLKGFEQRLKRHSEDEEVNKKVQRKTKMSQLWQMEETSMFFACNYAAIVKGEHVWYIDSGCSNHMTAHESMLINLDKNVLTRIKMENGQLVQAIAKETLVIETKRGVNDDQVVIFEDKKLESHVVNLRQKLDESSMKGIFVGYGKMEKGYKIYNLKIRVILSRSVLFDEKSVWN
ncbi:uncharacterized protein [Malus domestica]|uniref:uncharacterized protein n=1 Tax=Malus domestica TaxID=3750 RepID=UPI003974F847